MPNNYVVIIDPMNWCLIAPHQVCLNRLQEAPENKLARRYPKKFYEKQHT